MYYYKERSNDNNIYLSHEGAENVFRKLHKYNFQKLG